MLRHVARVGFEKRDQDGSEQVGGFHGRSVSRGERGVALQVASAQPKASPTRAPCASAAHAAPPRDRLAGGAPLRGPRERPLRVVAHVARCKVRPPRSLAHARNARCPGLREGVNSRHPRVVERRVPRAAHAAPVAAPRAAQVDLAWVDVGGRMLATTRGFLLGGHGVTPSRASTPSSACAIAAPQMPPVSPRASACIARTFPTIESAGSSPR